MQLPAACRRVARTGDPDGIPGELLRLREDPLEHQHLGEAGDDPGAGRGWRGRDEIDGPAPRGERSFGVSRDPSELGQAVMREAETGAVPAAVGRRDRGIQVGRRADGLAGGEGGLGGARR